MRAPARRYYGALDGRAARPSAPATIHTEGITTVHTLSIAPGLDRGQRDFYTVTSLRCTAQRVDC